MKKVIALLLLYGCHGVSTGSSPPLLHSRPEGWTAASHGKRDVPDAETVFHQEVKRIDLVLDAGDWLKMWSDMVDLLGPFGGTSSQAPTQPPTGTPPREVIEACVGAGPGSACHALVSAMEISGTCTRIPTGELACVPDDHLPPAGPGELPEPPAEVLTACVGRASGSRCSAQLPTEQIEGRCEPTPDGKLACVPDGAPPPGEQMDLVPRRPIFRPATVRFEGKSWHYVGLRFKGNSTLAHPWQQGIEKLPFRLDFDQFEEQYPETDDQRFYGFKKLVLNNNANDPSLLRDHLTASLLRRMGIPAPQTAFYAVYVDQGSGPEYFGLYTMAEVPDDPFLREQFDEADGNLYEARGLGATWSVWDPTAFDPKTEGDGSDLLPIHTALHADRSDPVVWRRGLEQAFDMDGFLCWLAANTVVQNWDAYGVSPQNYYLYSGNGPAKWIAWDHNEAFKPGIGQRVAPALSLAEVDERWPLIRFALDDAHYREVYRDYVDQMRRGPFEDFSSEIRAKAEMIRSAVVGIAGERGRSTFLPDPTAFDMAITALLDHVNDRHRAVASFLE